MIAKNELAFGELEVVDLFAGGGGFSEALRQACTAMGIKFKLLALNHWDKAIETHNINMPEHLADEADLFKYDPNNCPLRRLGLLIASPECTHHSVAAGGAPKNEQSRSQANIVYKWAKVKRPPYIIMENVCEWADWGPLDENKKAIKSRKGELFNKFVRDLKNLGYKVEWETMVSADYGDPTTRRRMYVACTLAGYPKFEFPAPTVEEKDWVPARDIIDWEDEGFSIFGTQEEAYTWAAARGLPKNRAPKRPMAPKTLRRIFKGLHRAASDELKPFISLFYGTSTGQDLDTPLSTVATVGKHAVCVPKLVELEGKLGPTLLNISHSKTPAERCIRELDKPLTTQVCKAELAIAHASLEPIVLGQQSCSAPRSVDKPLPTVATKGAISLSKPTIITFYGTDQATDVDNPLPTVTCKDRFGVVTTYGLDIKFRMFRPRELARSMSFPDDYLFAGNMADQVRQIGNAVSVKLAGSMIQQALHHLKPLIEINENK